MKTIQNAIDRFVQKEDGQTLIEYSLIGAVVAIGTIAAMVYMRGQIYNLFVSIGQHIGLQ